MTMPDDLETALRNSQARRRLPPPEVRRALRVNANVSQAAVAAAVGVSAEEVCRWERGTRTPRPGPTLDKYLDTLNRLAAAAVGVRV